MSLVGDVGDLFGGHRAETLQVGGVRALSLRCHLIERQIFGTRRYYGAALYQGGSDGGSRIGRGSPALEAEVDVDTTARKVPRSTVAP